MRCRTILVLVCVAGCGGKEQKPLAGGKSVAYWVEALKGPDVRLRQRAVAKLGNVGAADPAAFPALLGALEDREAGVRQAAILALVKFSCRAEEITPRLDALTRSDPDEAVRVVAGKALEALRRRKE